MAFSSFLSSTPFLTASKMMLSLSIPIYDPLLLPPSLNSPYHFPFSCVFSSSTNIIFSSNYCYYFYWISEILSTTINSLYLASFLSCILMMIYILSLSCHAPQGVRVVCKSFPRHWVINDQWRRSMRWEREAAMDRGSVAGVRMQCSTQTHLVAFSNAFIHICWMWLKTGA